MFNIKTLMDTNYKIQVNTSNSYTQAYRVVLLVPKHIIIVTSLIS